MSGKKGKEREKGMWRREREETRTLKEEGKGGEEGELEKGKAKRRKEGRIGELEGK